ncbi:MAG: HIT family protein [Ferrimicrobium sp.]
MECAFCTTIREPNHPYLITRDNFSAVIVDRAPVAFGHVLVVPIRHVTTIIDLDDTELCHFATRLRALIAAVPLACKAEGALTLTNTIVGQEVMHLHTHVIPRSRNDSLQLAPWPRTHYDAVNRLNNYKRAIQRAIEQPHPTTDTIQ